MKRTTRLLTAVALLLLASGCQQVRYHQKRAFSNPLMAFDEGATATHFEQKVFYSMEGSAGGIGTGAGGGCGCY